VKRKLGLNFTFNVALSIILFASIFLSLSIFVSALDTSNMDYPYVVSGDDIFGLGYDSIYGLFNFEGKIGYIANVGEKSLMVFDNIEHKMYDSVAKTVMSVQYADGKLAYEARDNGSSFIVYDGTELTHYDGVKLLQTYNNRLAYLAWNKSKSYFIYGDTIKQLPYWPDNDFFITELNGSVVYGTVYQGEDSYVVVDGLIKGWKNPLFLEFKEKHNEYIKRVESEPLYEVLESNGRFRVLSDSYKSSKYDKILYGKSVFDIGGTPVFFAQRGCQNYLVKGNSETEINGNIVSAVLVSDKLSYIIDEPLPCVDNRRFFTKVLDFLFGIFK